MPFSAIPLLRGETLSVRTERVQDESSGVRGVLVVTNYRLRFYPEGMAATALLDGSPQHNVGNDPLVSVSGLASDATQIPSSVDAIGSEPLRLRRYARSYFDLNADLSLPPPPVPVPALASRASRIALVRGLGHSDESASQAAGSAPSTSSSESTMVRSPKAPEYGSLYESCPYVSIPLRAISKMQVVSTARGKEVFVIRYVSLIFGVKHEDIYEPPALRRCTDLRIVAFSFNFSDVDATTVMQAMAPRTWEATPVTFASLHGIASVAASQINGWKLFTFQAEMRYTVVPFMRCTDVHP